MNFICFYSTVISSNSNGAQEAHISIKYEHNSTEVWQSIHDTGDRPTTPDAATK